MDANFVTINTEVADIIPWQNRTLKTEKLSRATVRMLIFTGLAVAGIALSILIFNYISINFIKRDLDTVKRETDKAANDLMLNAYNAMQSNTIKHMVRIQEILDGLSKLDSTLVRYEVTGDRVEWEALVPPAFVQTVIKKYGVRVDEKDRSKDERIRVIGNR